VGCVCLEAQRIGFVTCKRMRHISGGKERAGMPACLCRGIASAKGKRQRHINTAEMFKITACCVCIIAFVHNEANERPKRYGIISMLYVV
jgi:hypothetical protein